MQKSWGLTHRFLIAFLFALSAWSCGSSLQLDEGYVLSQNDSIFYKTVGKGEPLLIIHGGPVLDHQYLLDHFYPLAATNQLIFYDQRASGRSQLSIPPSRMTFDAMIADIEAIRLHFGYDQLALLGHSWGGLIAMKYAIKHQDQLNKLILSNSMAPSTTLWNEENRMLAGRYSATDREQMDKLSSSGLMRSKNAAPYIEQMMMLSYKVQFYDQEKSNGLSLYITDDYYERSAIFMQLSSEMSTYDLMKDLATISIPTLLISGESEPAKDLYMTEFAEAFQHAQVQIIEKAGHLPFIEQPERYFRVIEAFLN